jgi:NADH-quinone oxidoreductase E subunit
MSFHPVMPYGTEEWHRSRRVTLPEGPEFAYTIKNRERFEEFAAHYPPEHRKAAVLHALYLAQEQQGYITANVARHVADVIGITTADVEDVVSYYVMFFRNPVGKFVLQVCNTLSCAVAGSERVLEELERTLGVKAGEIDPTGLFTIQPMECLGACDRAPVVMVNNEHWRRRQRLSTQFARRASPRSTVVISPSKADLKTSGEGRRRHPSSRRPYRITSRC